MKTSDRKKLYQLLYDDAKATHNDKRKLEAKLIEALNECSNTKEKEQIMNIILKNCDKIDEALDTMKYYAKILENLCEKNTVQ
jgi:hypothetical protein